MQSLKLTPKEEPFIRYETEPDYQMQVDWEEFRRGKECLSAFIATLGFAERLLCYCYFSERLPHY